MTRINTNVESLIARRTLGINNTSLNRSLLRLSTGLRINSGRDDPAGLIASEMLRASLRATSTAIDNAIRADTIISVAEGGLQEISSLLLDLETLVDQSANEAGLTAAEVSANQLQIDSILQSIDRIANSTAFGDKKLLNGNFDFNTSGINVNTATGSALTDLDKVQINAAKIPHGATRAVNINVVSESQFASVSAVGAAGTAGSGDISATTIQIRGVYGSEVLSFAQSATAADVVAAVNASSQLTGVSATVPAGGGATSILFSSTTYGANAFVSVKELGAATALNLSGGSTQEDYGVNGSVTVNGTAGIVDGLDVSVRAASLSLDLTLTAAFGGTAPPSGGRATSFDIKGGGALFAISPTVGLAGTETIGIGEVSSAGLGNKGLGFLASLGSGLTNDLASTNFAAAQRIVRSAINEVATLRGRLGGFQKHTLQSTINALLVARENVTAAESAIRDADFAVETANLTRAQILVSSATTILQIANAQPQNALALLG